MWNFPFTTSVVSCNLSIVQQFHVSPSHNDHLFIPNNCFNIQNVFILIHNANLAVIRFDIFFQFLNFPTISNSCVSFQSFISKSFGMLICSYDGDVNEILECFDIFFDLQSIP